MAMKNAGAAMKQIHGKMTMEDVDLTMYVFRFALCYEEDTCLYAGTSKFFMVLIIIFPFHQPYIHT